MTDKLNAKSGFRAGMYLLETLTAGMYNNPLSIYREYIQNAADSIDISLYNKRCNSKKIYINLDPGEKSITIYDEGSGISADHAKKLLSSVGISSKTNSRLRGFRGIGRLGGLAFCDFATFRTKAKGEDIESFQEWDCIKLRYELSNSAKMSYSLRQLFNKTTSFYQKNSKKKLKSYFEVKLFGVQSFRNYIMDIRRVYNYLSLIAPVPLNIEQLSFANDIDSYLSSNMNSYNYYDIILNGEPVFKPYRDLVMTCKGHDAIDGFEPVEIKVNEVTLAYGWFGKRKRLLGSIAKGEQFAGIRVRDGNIQIGDSHILDGCFRESRFNSYMIGELHVNHVDLIPNSRRDDFIDNKMKGLFYDAVEREIGLPISKEIRLISRLNSNKEGLNHKELEATPLQITKDGNSEESNHHKNGGLHNETYWLAVFQIMNKECSNCVVLNKILKSNG